MAVISKKELLNFNFFLKALHEKKNYDKKTFYETIFELDGLDSKNKIYKNVKGNTLPGIIAFSFYSGSYLFLFFLMFILNIFASVIEYSAFKLSNNNLIFSSLIAQVVAFRLIHFGYLPSQSYLLFGAIILTICLVFTFNIIQNYKIQNDRL